MEENGRPHPERDFLGFRPVPQVRKGGDEESRGHLTRRACAESDSRPTFAEDGHQDDGLESSTHTITGLRNFRFSGSLYIGLSLLLCVITTYLLLRLLAVNE